MSNFPLALTRPLRNLHIYENGAHKGYCPLYSWVVHEIQGKLLHVHEPTNYQPTIFLSNPCVTQHYLNLFNILRDLNFLQYGQCKSRKNGLAQILIFFCMKFTVVQ